MGRPLNELLVEICCLQFEAIIESIETQGESQTAALIYTKCERERKKLLNIKTK